MPRLPRQRRCGRGRWLRPRHQAVGCQLLDSRDRQGKDPAVLSRPRHQLSTEYEGYETSEIRKDFGYRKIKDKAADRFESHCCDSLTLACAVGTGEAIKPGPFLASTTRTERSAAASTTPNRPRAGLATRTPRALSRGSAKGCSSGRRVGRAGSAGSTTVHFDITTGTGNARRPRPSGGSVLLSSSREAAIPPSPERDSPLAGNLWIIHTC